MHYCYICVFCFFFFNSNWCNSFFIFHGNTYFTGRFDFVVFIVNQSNVICQESYYFFSIFRKAIIVVPLTLVLPHVAGLGVAGVFVAEPSSNLVGGLASFITMRFALRRLCPKEPAPAAEG